MTTQATLPRPAKPLARLRDPAWYQEYGVYAAVAVVLLFNALFTEHFMTADNLRTQLVQVAPIVIVALGMALVIGTEGIDLSVGSTMALAAALGTLTGFPVTPRVSDRLGLPLRSNGLYRKNRVEGLHQLFGRDGHEARRRIILQQRAHVLDGLRGREHRQPLAQRPHSMHASARSGDAAERIV